MNSKSWKGQSYNLFAPKLNKFEPEVDSSLCLNRTAIQEPGPSTDFDTVSLSVNNFATFKYFNGAPEIYVYFTGFTGRK